jgi:hypothetical protein
MPADDLVLLLVVPNGDFGTSRFNGKRILRAAMRLRYGHNVST